MPRLTPDERVRRDRYVRDTNRHAFVVTRALVRAVLSQHGPSAPDAWRFVTNAHGCPSVVDTQAGAPPTRVQRVAHRRAGGAGRRPRPPRRRRRRGRAPCRARGSRRTVLRTGRGGRPSRPARRRAAARVLRLLDAEGAYIKARGMGLAIPLGDFAFVLRPPRRRPSASCRASTTTRRAGSSGRRGRHHAAASAWPSNARAPTSTCGSARWRPRASCRDALGNQRPARRLRSESPRPRGPARLRRRLVAARRRHGDTLAHLQVVLDVVTTRFARVVWTPGRTTTCGHHAPGRIRSVASRNTRGSSRRAGPAAC